MRHLAMTGFDETIARQRDHRSQQRSRRAFEPTELEQVISPQVAKQMVKMMEVVVEDGTAKRAQVPVIE